MFVNRRWMKRCKFIKKISNIFKNTGVDRNDAADDVTRSRGKTYPVFLVFLECPLSEVEMTLEPRKMLLEFEHPEAILAFIQDAIEEKLKSHNLLMPEIEQLSQDDDLPKRFPIFSSFFFFLLFTFFSFLPIISSFKVQQRIGEKSSGR